MPFFRVSALTLFAGLNSRIPQDNPPGAACAGYAFFDLGTNLLSGVIVGIGAGACWKRRDTISATDMRLPLALFGCLWGALVGGRGGQAPVWASVPVWVMPGFRRFIRAVRSPRRGVALLQPCLGLICRWLSVGMSCVSLDFLRHGYAG